MSSAFLSPKDFVTFSMVKFIVRVFFWWEEEDRGDIEEDRGSERRLYSSSTLLSCGIHPYFGIVFA